MLRCRHLCYLNTYIHIYMLPVHATYKQMDSWEKGFKNHMKNKNIAIHNPILSRLYSDSWRRLRFSVLFSLCEWKPSVLESTTSAKHTLCHTDQHPRARLLWINRFKLLEKKEKTIKKPRSYCPSPNFTTDSSVKLSLSELQQQKTTSRRQFHQTYLCMFTHGSNNESPS